MSSLHDEGNENWGGMHHSDLLIYHQWMCVNQFWKLYCTFLGEEKMNNLKLFPLALLWTLFSEHIWEPVANQGNTIHLRRVSLYQTTCYLCARFSKPYGVKRKPVCMSKLFPKLWELAGVEGSRGVGNWYWPWKGWLTREYFLLHLPLEKDGAAGAFAATLWLSWCFLDGATCSLKLLALTKWG